MAASSTSHCNCVGDYVLLRPTEGNRPTVARVEKFEQDNMDRKRVHVRRFYRPEETVGGRQCFHRNKELFLSDHYDVHSVDTIEGKCFVHAFGKRLAYETANDYFCRFPQ
ncbi:putative BAH domain-containing protein [Medicago truncatula]|uniref:Putative BAH domain-containing protein n=1 Tax=Medicago truncatula TaxID=3880 RepID=A0A396JBS9_MEDTR|nr:putative BAH domain-containing protein [Medicago truncatula]